MNLREYADTLTAEQKLEWCEKSGIKRSYLNQLLGGHSRPHPLALRRLCEHSGWACNPVELMPEVFEGIPIAIPKKSV